MANYRIKLSDGTTTIDIFGGSDTKVREGGLAMPPPEVLASYVQNPFSDGARLASSKYGSRQISITCKIWGSTLADLKTNIRSIHRLLNDAEKRTLLGYGAQVYLEYQWGDAANESTFFDILRGDLIMPADYLNILLSGSYYVTNATINLICKPLGRYTNQDYAQQTIENDTYATDSHYNYFDITTAEAYGDTPARMYIKIAQGAAAGTKKVWVAKRSGVRYNDVLFIQGEDETSVTNIYPGAIFALSNSDEADVVLSGNAYKRVRCTFANTNSVDPQEISRINYDIASPPRGHFRILIYCKVTEPAGGTWTYNRMSWGFGYSYGDITTAPVVADGDYYICAANNTWQVLDLGEVQIPPIAESDIATNNTFQLRVYQYLNTRSDSVLGATADWCLDYIFLLPIDEGVVIVDDIATTDVIAIDGLTDPNNVFIITAAGAIEDYPDYVGKPFSLGRETTRVYFLRDDDKAMTFTVDVKYQPQFLVI